jgi:predicted DNA-binding transcriptional regulator AlpA
LSPQESKRRQRQRERDRDAEQARRDQHLHDEAVLRPRAASPKAKQSDGVGIGHNRGPPLDHDLAVMTLRQFAALNGFSFMTVKRLFKRGEGPITIQLSPKRVGVRMIDARRWQESRLRSA